MDLSLFPKGEEWGTGDEAQDLKLTSLLKNTLENLSLHSIRQFYIYGTSLKSRAYNPALSLTITFVAKALLAFMSPEECNDHLFKKCLGSYELKKKINFHLIECENFFSDLKKLKRSRYEGQIDFALYEQQTIERNPFVLKGLKKSANDLQAKIVFKEFKNYLNGDDNKSYQNSLLQSLRLGENILVIEQLGEIWYHQDQLFAISTLNF